MHNYQELPSSTSNYIVRGLDIGTGASAVYPVLGVACFPQWRFFGTDIDASSLAHAKQHIVEHPENGSRLSDRISLLHVNPSDPYIPSQEMAIEFTMCNPPFYTNFEEMDRSAQLKRLPANAVSHHVLALLILPFPLTPLFLSSLSVEWTGMPRLAIRNGHRRGRSQLRSTDDT